MQALQRAIVRFSKVLNELGVVVLTLMMFLTVLDVVLRYLGRPITGTFELMAFAGATVIACAVPVTSLEGGHVCVDFLVEQLPRMLRKAFEAFTRVLGIIFFFLLGWNLFAHGNSLYVSGDVSQTLHVPYYPVAYILGVCSFAECSVLLSGLMKTFSRSKT